METAFTTVAFFHDQADKGLMTDAAARKMAADAIRAMHYDAGNYYFIWTLEGTGVAHGSHPEWEGQNFVDGSGAPANPVVGLMVSRLLDVAKSDKKEGVTSYRIQRPGQSAPIDKISYTKLFEPWGWSIGTGAYVDDIEASFWKESIAALKVFGALIAVAGLLTFLIGRNLARALNRLSERVASVANGEFGGEIPGTERNDEVGVMARALLVLRDNSKDAVELRFDQLTGLPARKMLLDQLRLAIGTSSRTGNFGGVMVIDLDRFKALNDAQGHDVGDMLLQEVARRLASCVREGDTVARLGGDEFVVVVIDIGLKEEEAALAIETIGKKILDMLGRPYELGHAHHVSTASVGMSVFRGNALSAPALLKQADFAMYRAKQSGANHCRFFDPQMEAAIEERLSLERDLRQALEQNQFELYFQGQVGPTGQLTGAEALVRWAHPGRGLIAPGDFIPLAEETGLIMPLGKWVLHSACSQLLLWSRQPAMAHLTLAINVSARQFHQPDYVEQVFAVLDQTGVDPRKLKLELTESMLLENLDDVIVKMNALKTRGLVFSLDDFGTGYCSLSYLNRLPLDQLKIDQSFVRNISSHPNGATIARTILSLGQSLGLNVIAEGVETIEERDFLAESGCIAYQGFFFRSPVPLERFEEFVHES